MRDLRHIAALFATALTAGTLYGQIKIRPDAFEPEEEITKSRIEVAYSVEEMHQWDLYPTYNVYVSMMGRYAEEHNDICKLDTIGTSLDNRLILCMKITGRNDSRKESKPQMFYTAAMHGDEIAGYHFMLHLIDTLVNGYRSSPEIRSIIDNIEIYINPLSNPDGTYYGGDSNINSARRNNANDVDLNRNYPDPFGISAKSIERENEMMIAYVERHHFALAANLHGGSEVMNYPWDSFTSLELQHPDAAWWEEVSRRYVDTCRKTTRALFRDVTSSGYIAGGDWYVIHNGRQDYMNYYQNVRELTMEVSKEKKLANNKLSEYWKAQAPALINYIKEVYTIEDPIAIKTVEQREETPKVYPNPTQRWVTIEYEGEARTIDLGRYATGLHLLNIGGKTIKIIKQ